MAAIDDEVRMAHARCGPHLARLAVLAGSTPSVPLPADAVTEVTEAAGAILALAEATGHVIVSAAASAKQAATGEFLTARLARLETAAAAAIAAARDGDATALRARLRRFDTLTVALWTVQRAVTIPAPAPSLDAATTTRG